jgi:hypothetical protein
VGGVPRHIWAGLNTWIYLLPPIIGVEPLLASLRSYHLHLDLLASEKKILLKTMFDFVFVNARVVLKGLSSEIFWLKVVSIVRSLLKGEAPRFSAAFNYPLSNERLFNFPRQLV